MDRNLLRAVFCWLVVFCSVSIPADSRLHHGRRLVSPSSPQSSPRGAHGDVQPRLSETQRQESAELDVRPPRPVVVKCHPDSMEVVMQADMLDAVLKVDGGHLRLGPEPLNGCGAVPSGAEEFTILARLTDCGTKLSVSLTLMHLWLTCFCNSMVSPTFF